MTESEKAQQLDRLDARIWAAERRGLRFEAQTLRDYRAILLTTRATDKESAG